MDDPPIKHEDSFLEQFFREQGPPHGYEPESVLGAWREQESGISLADYLVEVGVLTRFGLLKLGAVQKGFLDLEDLLQHVLLPAAPPTEGDSVSDVHEAESPGETHDGGSGVEDDDPILGEYWDDDEAAARPAPSKPIEVAPAPSPVLARRALTEVGDQTGRVLRVIRAGMRLGQIQLKEQLDVGGTGVIFAGEHLGLGHEVVVKVLKPVSLEGQGRRRFATEGRAASRLRDECFVQVYEAHSEGELDYLVMERVPGVTLKAYLGGRAFEPKPAARLLLGMARILEVAHRRGVVHRDIKPQNFFVTPERHLKLGDFGLARILDEREEPAGAAALEEAGEAFGTPNYVAPEQILDMSCADHRADMYSLGVVLFELLTGSLPFAGETSLETLQKQIRETPPIERLPGEVPEALRRVLSRLLAKQPEARYADYSELIGELRAFLDDRPLPASKGTRRTLFSGLRRWFGGEG